MKVLGVENNSINNSLLLHDEVVINCELSPAPILMIKCTVCKITKEEIFFNRKKDSSNGRDYRCNSCKKEYNRQFYLKNQQRIIERVREYDTSNKERTDIRRKKYYQKNKDRILQYNHDHQPEWYQKSKVQKRAYQIENWENIKKRVNIWRKRKIKEDPIFMLRYRLRHRFAQAFREGYKKGSAIQYLGCSIEDLKKHLESQFLTGMNWSNYGKENNQWNIDHRIPLASIDPFNEEQIQKVCHYSNLQPMWHVDNLKKGAKVC